MPQGQKTIPEMQWAVVRLAKFLNHERIGICLNLSTHSIKQILAHFHQYGTIPNPGGEVVQKEKVGRRHLSDIDVKFLLGMVQKTLDLYLDELQEMLQASCGTEVSCAMVWRMLCRYGFTMKKVSCDF
ncbi:hypothetical protein PAXRUDRAFT_166741 [Paxillus rubicundulus Ve08.2h10]|uniref:Winged helix-turn helix domain-containing protein n=1 Tax=Paxillus rubicundulus Ve08.2h10 TaxID=930991 RepID=A0A0D0C2X1_9AGAM|nr:hypothetical protein PAXRUDRAFT_166741 [Paxillus rubicundulus Ve08.2h10]